MLRTTSSDRPRFAVAAGGVGVGPAERVAAEAVELGVRGLGNRGHCAVLLVVGAREAVVAGRGSCRRRRRGRWWPVAGRGCRAGARRPRSRPRTARGTARRRGRPGSGAGTAAHPRAARSPAGAGRGSVAVAGERLGERLRPRLASGAAVDDRAVARLELGDPLAGERRDRLPAAALGEEAQRAGGEVVVGLVEGVAAGVGDREQPWRAAAAARGGRRGARAPRSARRPAGRRGGGGRRRG